MNKEMRDYTYIQNLGNGKHLIEDNSMRQLESNEVSLMVAEVSPSGYFNYDSLSLRVISTYPEYLRKK